MSLHAQLTPEAQARLAAQRRTSTITSAVISILSIVLVALVLGLFLLPNIIKETPTIVTYQANEVKETEHQQERVKTAVLRKPSSPSSSMARVIAATTTSAVSIPVPDAVVDIQSVEFGDGDDFGGGWGDGDGSGAGGGASFFNQKVKGQRIAYVIDYSASMKGERDALMRKELQKSVKGLKAGTQYQMIFFSGPAWVAGSKVVVKDPGGAGTATVKGDGGKTYEWTGKGLGDWTPKGKRQPAEWLSATSSQLAESLEIIQNDPLSGGTDWENPLLMALEMDPAPEIIFFMTDGAVSGRDMMALTKSLASVANTHRTVINTIALMEPKAEEPMADLAKRTDGQFTVVNGAGKANPAGGGKKGKKGKK